MPNVKISAAADAGTLLSSDMLPLARSGDSNAYHCTMAEVATFASGTLASGAYGNTGRNLLHNPYFNVQQRGGGPFTTAFVYTADRWISNFATDTVSVQCAAATDTDRTQIGDEAAQSLLLIQATGNSATGAFTQLAQRIEGVRRTGNKQVTVSFWAKLNSGGPKLGVSLDQSFGTGGSPSAGVNGTGQSVTLTTSFARYSLTFTVPSTAGVTLGTNANDWLQLNFWFSSGATNNTRAGSIGVQTISVALWGVQLEIGATATPLAKRDPADDLALCQRFYQTVVGGWGMLAPSAIGSGVILIPLSLFVSMRSTPATVVVNPSGVGNYSAVVLDFATASTLVITPTISGAGAANFAYTITASADL